MNFTKIPTQEYSSHPITARAPDSSVTFKTTQFSLEAKALNFRELLRIRFEKAGWTIRQHLNDLNFRLPELAGRQIAFSMADERGKVLEYAGVLKHSGRTESAFFQLEGREEFFNANLVGIMAVEKIQDD